MQQASIYVPKQQAHTTTTMTSTTPSQNALSASTTYISNLLEQKGIDYDLLSEIETRVIQQQHRIAPVLFSLPGAYEMRQMKDIVNANQQNIRYARKNQFLESGIIC